jgi:hypothetical protein
VNFKLKYLMLLASMLGASFFVDAQNYEDVLRYSQKYVQGTARSSSMAGAVGALGADFTAISVNPAGIGLYRRPEFTLTFNVNHQQATGNYLGRSSEDDRYNLAINNLGLVIADVKLENNKPREEGWISVNYGFGFNRTNNFNSRVVLQGFNTADKSILTSYREQANTAGFNGGGAPPSQLDPFSFPYMAWAVGLLQTTNSDSTDYSEIFNYQNENKYFKKTFQSDEIVTNGSMNDIVLSIGANNSNRLYVGANLLVPTVGYTYNRTFTEVNRSDTVMLYQNAVQKEYLRTSGVGISAAFGAIYRFSDNFRAGISIQTPVFYSLSDQYHYELSGTFKGVGTYTSITDDAYFRYSIITPTRFTLSGSYIFGKKGFISADYEFANYRSGRINTTFEGARDKNDALKEVLAAGNNLRIGGEYRINSFALRAGYAIYSKPYQSGLTPQGYSGASHILALGAGLRSEDYFLDFGYQKQFTSYYHLPYMLTNKEVEGATIKSNRGSFILTIGSRF